MNTAVVYPISTDGSIFNISKTSDETMTLPLISMMLSDNVTTSINGTLISCTEYYTYLDVWMMNALTTRLHIIEPGAPNYGRFYHVLLTFSYSLT